MVDKTDPRAKLIPSPDIVYVELDGPRGRGLGYYKRNIHTVQASKDHPKIDKVAKHVLKK